MNTESSTREEIPRSRSVTILIWPVTVWLVWTLATYLLEGQIRLYQHPTIPDRYTYVLIANVLIGTIGAVWFARRLLDGQFVSSRQLGYQSAGQILGAVAVALVIGGTYLWVMRPSGASPLLLFNGYVQVLPVSIAEVLVCWMLLGSSFESVTIQRGKRVGLLVGLVSATLFFSIYHLGHSPPFNQIEMMIFLLVPGLITSIFFFVSREIYATILFHNFQGTVGVVGNLQNPEILNQPTYSLYFLALIACAALIGSNMFLLRKARS